MFTEKVYGCVDVWMLMWVQVCDEGGGALKYENECK